MSGFNRDRFQGAKMASIVDARKEAEKKSGYSQDGRPGFHSIEEGVNLFRIAPPHDPKNPPFQPIRSTWLKCSVPKLDDNYKETGEYEVRNKRIFIATIHGGAEKDIVETYISYVKNKVNDEVADKDERSKKLAPITGWKDKSGKWNPGIYPSTNYVFYAWDKSHNLGRIELYPSDIKQMEKLNISEDTGEPIETDVFSDPSEEGLWMAINITKNDKNKWDRIITKKSFNPQGIKPADMAEKYQEFLATSMVTDEMLMKLAEKESLEEVYGENSYTLRDFEMALDGLQRFDSENGYSIFENEDFLEEVKEMMEWAYSLESKEKTQQEQSTKTEEEPEPEKKPEFKKLVVEPTPEPEPEKKVVPQGLADFKNRLKAQTQSSSPEPEPEKKEATPEPPKTEPKVEAPKTVNIQEQLAMLKKKMDAGK